MILNKEDFEHILQCPWCETKEFILEYKNDYECDVVRCPKCGLVYAKKILANEGKQKYWDTYLSTVHQSSTDHVKKRRKMYQIEFEYIHRMMQLGDYSKILDVGCGNGEFLELFAQENYQCFGVEYGAEAAKEAGKKFMIYQGEFPLLNIEEHFDLIIFRGSIQYFVNPKSYFQKAIELLNPGGLIFITSSPNANALCFKLFGKKFTLPVSVCDYCAYHEELLVTYFESQKLNLVNSYHFYEETPYADYKNDILAVSQAIREKDNGLPITNLSPAFYGNMLTLVFKK